MLVHIYSVIVLYASKVKKYIIFIKIGGVAGYDLIKSPKFVIMNSHNIFTLYTTLNTSALLARSEAWEIKTLQLQQTTRADNKISSLLKVIIIL
jgi:hypothetical protein